MEGLMDSELTNGKTLQFIKEASKMVSDMEKANGSWTKLNIWEITLKDLNKDTDNYICPVETFIKEILFKIKDKDMGKCFGMIVRFTKGSGKVGFNMEKDSFR